MKNIIIIGGGISGAATLHYLNKKFSDNNDVNIFLLEKESVLGGTINSANIDGIIFESGPNAFLTNTPSTLEFIDELDLRSSLIEADLKSKYRFIASKGQLAALPYSFSTFLKFRLLTSTEKLKLVLSLFVPFKITDKTTVGEIAEKAVGVNFKNYVMDPFVSGIHAGNVNKLNLKLAFPRLYTLLSSGKSIISQAKKNKSKTKSILNTFKKGMQEPLIKLTELYHDQIYCNKTVLSILSNGDKFTVRTSDGDYDADQVIISTPAYIAADFLKSLNSKLSNALSKIKYSPIAVVGLSFKREDISEIPEGFGMLIPSIEKNLVLGVLFESQIFPQRYSKDDVVIRVMLGGAHHKNIIQYSQNEIIARALKELSGFFKVDNMPKNTFLKFWKRGIPQYTNEYSNHISIVESELNNLPNMHIVSNFYKGVSFNDCIKNAKKLAETIKI